MPDNHGGGSSSSSSSISKSSSWVASPHGKAMVEDEQAEVGLGFQQQVYVRLQVIERKLDSLVYKLPAPSCNQLHLPPELQPLRKECSLRHPSKEPKSEPFTCVLPGVPSTEFTQDSLKPPMSPPPPGEPLHSNAPSTPGARKENDAPLKIPSQAHAHFLSDLDSKRPSLFQRSSSRIKPAKPTVLSPCMRALHRLDEGLGLDRLRSSRTTAMKRYSKTKLWRLVHSMPFQVVISLVIVVNALFIGLTTDAELSAFMRHESPHEMWARCDIFFCAVFFVELSLRAMSERGLFFYGEEWMWNLFDTVLVILSVVDTVLNNIDSIGMANLGAARIFRFVRFVRLVRLARAARAVHSLRLFILSIFASGMSLIWCALIVSIIVYFFAVCFLNGVTEYFRDGAHGAEEEATVEKMYGNVWLAMVTLFMCISGGVDWQEAMEPLVSVHWAYEPVFVYFIFFMFFGVLNIVIGAFVTATNEISKKDRELLVSAELDAVEAYTRKIKEFFAEADKDMSGMLSWDEFEEHLKNPKVSAYFASLELDVSNAHRLFRLLDTDGSNEVGLDEFLDGCMRLKGQARSIDVNMLVYEIERMSRQISHIIEASHDGRLWVSGQSGDVFGARQVLSP